MSLLPMKWWRQHLSSTMLSLPTMAATPASQQPSSQQSTWMEAFTQAFDSICTSCLAQQAQSSPASPLELPSDRASTLQRGKLRNPAAAYLGSES
ncbi:Hypothetical predicted protein [Pelobates cultripes]|uniref:Secreted protein n=1 Tax=Pelobates cultripes TaxID=61616 RepID=A0AAD1SRI9_PELCU|nr:Hypothetical predicted protein [Pelobates cultripes]